MTDGFTSKTALFVQMTNKIFSGYRSHLETIHPHFPPQTEDAVTAAVNYII